jgi:chemotaxis protein methyltransferase CheR
VSEAPQEAQQFADLTEKISRERGFRCGSYKEKCLRRRIAVRMRAKGVHTFSDYGRMLDSDPGEYDRLLDALTINVTKFFRNWETYDAISRLVVPVLWSSSAPTIRVWSAGCASGEEPYSLAILFHRHAAELGEEGQLAKRLRVLGSDIDRRSLASAERGMYQEAAFLDTPPALRAQYFVQGAEHAVVPHIRQLVTFERRDVLREGPPPGQLNLIVCRNVIIYFDRDSQEALFERFHASLAKDGFLVLGKVETLLGQGRKLFAAVDGRERIFRRA